ncbi:leucyl-tRNA synthetase [Pseudovirgaria hyperparasitica]|uniref:leucine--tRNA ligase n=1 Tax=Pseudovirgaria hyperparasitica TaxID=470096 RepID=A0A6A6WJD9_9PEZI|nr:leucyl-tRNA synthetase [Pseudovirgaria hyperparasitica]KAF2762345.1 leucyl-tRNA synthetase [Pseudovirgaria hyperparasitica]
MAAAKATLDAMHPDHASTKTMKIENTEKRDALISIEQGYQKKWQSDKVFEPEAPSLEEIPFGSMTQKQLHEKYPKFMVTVAFPYMNGTLHMGHAFTFSKAEFQAGFNRLQGKRTLFPLGFHCTGMPIKACADKLEREVELFGKNFERCNLEDVQKDDKDAAPPPTQETRADVTKFQASKGKAAAKTVKTNYQFQIMLSLGIPLEEIHTFADPQKWLTYFPPLAKRDLTDFGFRIDWRRQFVTTDANPYFDTFIRWQMVHLKQMGKIKFGKRYTVYSPKDGQACLDHDRSSGEGVTVQEYTALKLEVKEWPEKAQEILAGKLPEGAKVYFIPATLRPETMYGQTCCFVGPNIVYGIYHVKDNEYFFNSERAARNMAFQEIFPTWGNFPKIAEFRGSDVVGTLVNAPMSVHTSGVRILPMDTVKDTKGTAVVTCVPSDSPDDYATTLELQKKADFYGIKKEWAELEIIPIIETPTYGNLTAKTLVEQLKINSSKDAKLAEAKDLAYKEGFYQGKMIIGEHKGKPVAEAKALVKKQLIESGLAFNYAEPDGMVVSRSADVCVAALLDQWYFNYGTTANGGDGEWCQQVLDYLEDGLNTYYPEAKNSFVRTVNWLAQWSCARSYGLGSKLPWDPSVMVESLSDSTIYQSYYTIAHYLHSDLYGTKPGAFPITPDQMTDEVWDYLFAPQDAAFPETKISHEHLQTMKRSFEYWYPLDSRISGKDLVNNHLSFCLYIHAALFPKNNWPQSIRINGHLMLNGEKMSKSTGNFLTLNAAIAKFGSDATRIALADAGDALEDANFEESVANAVILKLYELKNWCESAVTGTGKDNAQRTGERNFWDNLFEDEMNVIAKDAYEQYDLSMYKLALKFGFYDFTSSRDSYREATKSIGMHRDLTLRYIELQALLLTPIAPHFAEYLWLEVLKKPSTIQSATFPEVPAPDATLSASRTYVRTTSGNITSAEGAQVKKAAKGKQMVFDPKKDKKLTIFAAQKFPAWQDQYIAMVQDAFKDMAINMKAVTAKIPKPDMKKAMPFVQSLAKRLTGGELPEAVFGRKLPFDELAVLKEMVPVLPVVKLVEVEIVSVDDGGKSGTVVFPESKNGEKRDSLPVQAEGSIPGTPTFVFENV